MTEQRSEPIEIGPEDLAEEPAAPAPPERLVIELEDLAEEGDAGERAFPGFLGPAPVPGLSVLALCSSQKGEFVLELTDRKEGGFWMRVADGKSPVGVGRTLTAQGPFAYAPNFSCPHCGAPSIVVCECGALFCHSGKPKAICPRCHRKLKLAGLASHVEAHGGEKPA